MRSGYFPVLSIPTPINRENKYRFLEEKYAITIRKTPASFAIPTHSVPDLIILDMGATCSKYLETLKTDQISIYFPILIIGMDPMEIDNSIESIKTIPPPFKEPFVLRMADDLLQKAKLSKRLAGSDWAESKKTDPKTILVLDIFKNIHPATFSYMEQIGFHVVLMEGEDDLLIRSIQFPPNPICRKNTPNCCKQKNTPGPSNGISDNAA